MCLCKQREKKLGKVSSISLCRTYWASSNWENANLKNFKTQQSPSQPQHPDKQNWWSHQTYRAEQSGVLPESWGMGKTVPSNLKNLWNLKQKATISLTVYYYISLTQDKEYLIILIASALGMGPLHLDKGAYKQQHFCLLRLRVRFYTLWED